MIKQLTGLLVTTGLLVASANTALANYARKILVTNYCNSDITIVVNYTARNGGTYTTGPWIIDAYETNQIPNALAYSGIIYYSAFNATHEWDNTAYFLEYDGERFYANKFVDNVGDINLGLRCP